MRKYSLNRIILYKIMNGFHEFIKQPPYLRKIRMLDLCKRIYICTPELCKEPKYVISIKYRTTTWNENISTYMSTDSSGIALSAGN